MDAEQPADAADAGARIMSDLMATGSMLQWPSELGAFVRFMQARRVRSFLEVGAATGRLTLFLKAALRLETAAACDLRFPPLLRRASGVQVFCGDHQSAAYGPWRAALGPIDMVLIDADHEAGFRRDYEIERAFPHRFLAFHDVANQAYPALRRFWRDEVAGDKVEIVNTDPTQPFGVPPIRFPFGPWPTLDAYVADCGRACGIGIVTSPAETA